MKYFWLCFICFGFACNDKPQPAKPSAGWPKILTDSNTAAKAKNPYVDVDVSPMDMSYLPENYPKMLVRNDQPVARVIYSRPHKQGRVIFGNLVTYGEPWRMGANEATEIEFFQPVTIQGKKINSRKFVMYCIPTEDQWTIVFNTNLNSWGLNLDSTKDVHSFTIQPKKMDQSVEFFSITFQETDTGADMVIGWDDVEARLPIQYRKQ